MVTKWLHIQYLGGDPWVNPIWSAVNEALERRACGPVHDELRQLGVHVSTRLTMLPMIYRRINQAVGSIRAAVANHKPHHEFTPGQEAYAFDLEDNLKFNLLLDSDSLLFELNSCCELMTCFFEGLYAHAGRALPVAPAGRAIRKILEDAGQPTQWFQELDSHRNFFIHSGAPYFAVDLSDPSSYDLLIMKKNLLNFDDEAEFLRVSTIAGVVAGFERAKPTIQAHLIGLFHSL